MHYPRLKPGTYELVASYDIPKNDALVTRLGLTPLAFRRTVAYLVIEQQKPNGSGGADSGAKATPPGR